jgi:hypothetical protein
LLPYFVSKDRRKDICNNSMNSGMILLSFN